MNLRDLDELELCEIFNAAFAAKQDAENEISAVQRERAYRKDMKLADLELELERLSQKEAE